jgi:hypothetical protein
MRTQLLALQLWQFMPMTEMRSASIACIALPPDAAGKMPFGEDIQRSIE